MSSAKWRPFCFGLNVLILSYVAMVHIIKNCIGLGNGLVPAVMQSIWCFKLKYSGVLTYMLTDTHN